ncbi:MAG TPA: hypothetical protein PKK56_03170 [archaeon]|jgi:hypothetical protein|nr:hypothetical protein [archaeon]HPC10059.1 hypothetical protein [archaeon]HRT03375.1 hypothetical protein [Candidatus Diapherotrites archaeon]
MEKNKIIFLIIGLIIGFLISWLAFNQTTNTTGEAKAITTDGSTSISKACCCLNYPCECGSLNNGCTGKNCTVCTRTITSTK